MVTQIANFMGPTWGPPGSYRPQMGLILAPWTLLSGMLIWLFSPFIENKTKEVKDPTSCFPITNSQCRSGETIPDRRHVLRDLHGIIASTNHSCTHPWFSSFTHQSSLTLASRWSRGHVGRFFNGFVTRITWRRCSWDGVLMNSSSASALKCIELRWNVLTGRCFLKKCGIANQMTSRNLPRKYEGTANKHTDFLSWLRNHTYVKWTNSCLIWICVRGHGTSISFGTSLTIAGYEVGERFYMIMSEPTSSSDDIKTSTFLMLFHNYEERCICSVGGDGVQMTWWPLVWFRY